jgi:hypothetical protein
MARNRVRTKNTPAKVDKKPFLLIPPEPTEESKNINKDDSSGNTNNSNNPTYTDAKKSKVEVDSTLFEIITKWLIKLGPWIVVAGVVIAVISSYLTFTNDLKNSQEAIENLKKSSREAIEKLKVFTNNNDQAITNVEKKQISTDSNVNHIILNYNEMKNDISHIQTDLKSVEIEQAKLSGLYYSNTKVVTK